MNVLSPLLDCTGTRKQIFECISPAFEFHRGEKANIWMYCPRIWTVPGRESKYLNVLSPFLSFTGAKKRIFECIVPTSKLHRGEEANIWIYGSCFQVSPGSRSKYLHIFAPAQNFQDIENNISHVYLSEVLPTKTPQSLFRLFATNLHKMSPVKVAQHRRLPWQDSLCRFYILSGIRIKSLTLKLSVPTLTTAQIFEAHQIRIYPIHRYRIVSKKEN